MESFPVEARPFSGECRTVPSANALEWLKQGWAIFLANPGMWLVISFMIYITSFVLLLISPFVALGANLLLMPALGAGLLHASHKAAADEMLDIADLIAGIKAPNAQHLLMLGAACVGAVLAVSLVLLLVAGGSAVGGRMAGHTLGAGLALGGLLFGMLLSLSLFVPIIMAIWFAPALVFFNRMGPMDAIKASFNACLKNVSPCMVFGLVVMLPCLFAVLTIGLGFLVLIPVLAGAAYVSYRDIFVAN